LKAEPLGQSGVDFNSNQWGISGSESAETKMLAAA
jgi:hypothetical protein